MYGKVFESDNDSYMLYVTIKCSVNKKFRVWSETYQKRNSKYADRVILVEKERMVHMNFPVAPKKLFIGVANADNPQDKDFEVTIVETPLKTYNIWLDEKSKRFISFAQHFCAQSGFEQASPAGRIFRTNDNEFVIKYYPVIMDNRSGAPMNTPAAVGHNTGNISVAKVKFDTYTVAMRMIILLHEYSHKYKNPKIGLKISDEIGADINALYMYLGLGYSKVDAICVFANVFLKAQTAENIKRMRKINDYIERFENEEYAQRD